MRRKRREIISVPDLSFRSLVPYSLREGQNYLVPKALIFCVLVHGTKSHIYSKCSNKPKQGPSSSSQSTFVLLVRFM